MAKFHRFHKEPKSYKKQQDDGQPKIQFELGAERRRVTVRKFRNMKLVDIREYYQKNEEWLPGTKGISLTEDQWGILVSKIGEINEALQAIDHKEEVEKRKEEANAGSEESDDSEEEDLEGVEFEDVVDERPKKRSRDERSKKSRKRSKRSD
ncbi:DEBR0S4_10506g1_1 [Brettanomyces bruxellensis]|uniref:DEBR0S4_10506g1_1 n=1 Tax=Dekkera bruxellensis TaxID=5007 RepID=A0A3F2Y7Q8_DEKBR|nr:DEBR0S4_10506g1_1 [Brettanomyces bruxellensis]